MQTIITNDDVDWIKYKDIKNNYSQYRPYFLRIEDELEKDKEFKRQYELQGYDPHKDQRLESGIKDAVIALINNGIVTYESCQGGDGHLYKEPTIRFNGNRTEGMKAYHILTSNGFNVVSISRIWVNMDGELTGPNWEIIMENED